VVGGTAEFTVDETSSNRIQAQHSKEAPNVSEPQSPRLSPSRSADLEAKVESIRLLHGEQIYGFATMTLVISKHERSKTYGWHWNRIFTPNSI